MHPFKQLALLMNGLYSLTLWVVSTVECTYCKSLWTKASSKLINYTNKCRVNSPDMVEISVFPSCMAGEEKSKPFESLHPIPLPLAKVSGQPSRSNTQAGSVSNESVGDVTNMPRITMAAIDPLKRLKDKQGKTLYSAHWPWAHGIQP